MKNSIIVLMLFAGTSLFAQHGGSCVHKVIGSEWKLEYYKVKNTHWAIDSTIGMHQIIQSKKFNTMVFRETKINPNTYATRTITLENLLTGEEYFSQKLENGVLNIITIDLGILKAKYPDTKDLNKQQFIVREYADDKVEEFYPKFVFDL